MNKVEFVKVLGEELGFTGVETKRVLDILNEVVEKLLKDGECISLGFGTLKMKDVAPKAEREGRNPATGDKVIIPAKPACIKPVCKLKNSFVDRLTEAV